jgi:hypothetical protein
MPHSFDLMFYRTFFFFFNIFVDGYMQLKAVDFWLSLNILVTEVCFMLLCFF